MLDTNVLISLLLFPNNRMDAMMSFIFEKHKLVISSYVADEVKSVIHRKFPDKDTVVEKLLFRMSYDYVYTPKEIDDNLFYIRDKKDYPVLYTAILENVDVLITGDKDFLDIELDKPEIVTPTEFIAEYL